MLKNASKIAIIIVLTVSAVGHAGFIDAAYGLGDIRFQAECITLDNIGGMAETSYTPKADYSFEFVYGSKNISDGSDFGAVRNAFNTWALPPSIAISSFEMQGGALDFRPGEYNGRNEISWIGASDKGRDIWSKDLDFDDSAIAVTMTWYYADSKEVVGRDIYFNDIDMDWRTEIDGGNRGFNVEHIALHEIGHIYGLNDVYNPCQPGYESWMGRDNQDLTMYGYSNRYNDDVTLSEMDIYAMSDLHWSGVEVPEPSSMVIFALAGSFIFVSTRRL